MMEERSLEGPLSPTMHSMKMDTECWRALCQVQHTPSPGYDVSGPDDDASVVSEITVDTDINSECSSINPFDDEVSRWGSSSNLANDFVAPLVNPQSSSQDLSIAQRALRRLSSATAASTGTESSKDTAPMKPLRRGSSHDRSRRRRGRHSTSTHSTCRTMITIVEEGEDSPAHSPHRGDGAGSRKLRSRPAQGIPTNRDVSMDKMMKEFLMSLSDVYNSGSSDTDESGTPSRQADKKSIKDYISEALKQVEEGSDAASESSSADSQARLRRPTPQMMQVIEKLSVKAALHLTGRNSNNKTKETGLEKPIRSGTDEMEKVEKEDDQSTLEQERVPGLEESSASSQSNGQQRYASSSPQSSSSPLKLTNEMKVLIEQLSVKAALSVISQKESSIVKEAVLGHTHRAAK